MLNVNIASFVAVTDFATLAVLVTIFVTVTVTVFVTVFTGKAAEDMSIAPITPPMINPITTPMISPVEKLFCPRTLVYGEEVDGIVVSINRAPQFPQYLSLGLIGIPHFGQHLKCSLADSTIMKYLKLIYKKAVSEACSSPLRSKSRAICQL